jgi:chromosome partitioning protein
MSTYAIANQKGGVGKTTTAVNLSHTWARAGLRVLVVDVDPQAAATTSLIAEELPEDTRFLSDLLWKDRAPSVTVVQADRHWGLVINSLANVEHRIDVIPAGLDLADIWSLNAPGLQFRLRNALAQIQDRYDRVIYDCPPDLGAGTVSALVAADLVIVPTRTERMALTGVARTVETVQIIGREMSHAVMAAIVPVAVDMRVRAHQDRVDDIARLYPKLITPPIPHRLKSDEASDAGSPAQMLKGNAGVALELAYKDLARVIDARAKVLL